MNNFYKIIIVACETVKTENSFYLFFKVAIVKFLAVIRALEWKLVYKYIL